jgi:hypothetical protein
VLIAGFVLAGRIVYMQKGLWALAGLWAIWSLILAYLYYRQRCGQPLTYDVISHPCSYWQQWAPRYTGMAAGALAVGCLVIVMTRHMNSMAADIILGTFSVLGSWIAIGLIV